MKLKELINVIDEIEDFILIKGDRIGIFNKKDKGLKFYLDEEVWGILVENNMIKILLNY